MEQRIIKFRAWDGKKMYFPEHSDSDDFFITPEGEVRYIHEIGVEGHKTDSRRNGWVLMQFTGLKDRAGKEIYEGDILEGHSDGIVNVEWSDANGGWECIFDDYANIGIAEMCTWFGNNATIIGNIHEQPELLTKPNQ